MKKNAKIFVAGHKGLIGSSILRKLKTDGYTNVVTREHSGLDLCSQSAVKLFFETEKPEYVFFAAARVGGVFANNTYRADFIYENTIMQSNVIHNSFLYEVKKLLFLSSADAYPVNYQGCVREKHLLKGPLEPTCEPFAVAKINGMKMCESYNMQYGTDFLVVTAPNVYGPHQHYDVLNAQVLPSLIKKFHEAKQLGAKKVAIWGTGAPVRDFLYVDDLADACIFIIKNCSGMDFINVGTKRGISIRQLARIVKSVVGYKGKIVFDITKPDGVSKKLLDVSKIESIGWKPKIELLDGVKKAYLSFIDELSRKEVRTSEIFDINICDKDKHSIKRLKPTLKHISRFMQPKDYSNTVVTKPWGYEFLAFENSDVAVWFLFIKRDHSTSMHCHPNKKTSLILLSGKAMSNTFMYWNYLRGGDALIIDKGVFHSTKVLSDEGICLLEIENPPKKTDLIRLEDRYGRQKRGYEGIAEMKTRNLNKYNYFFFKDISSSDCIYENDRFVVSFSMYKNNAEFQKQFKVASSGLYTCCKGKLYDMDNSIILDTGNTQKAGTLSTLGKMKIKGKTVILYTKSKDI